MVVLILINGNELILGMSLIIKILEKIGPSIVPKGTQYKLNFDLQRII